MKSFLLNNLVFAQEKGETVRELLGLPPLTKWNMVMRVVNFVSLFLLPVAIILFILGLIRLVQSKSEQDVKSKSGKIFIIVAVAIFVIWIISSFLQTAVMNINIIICIIVLLSAFWVYFDSRKFKQARLTGSPLAWAILIFLCWLPTFPIYLILRFLKYRKLLANPAYQPNKLAINLGIILSVAAFIIVVVFYLNSLFNFF